MLTNSLQSLRERPGYNFSPRYVPTHQDLDETELHLVTAYQELQFLASCPGTDSEFRARLDQAMMALAALAKPFDAFKTACFLENGA